jgi:hypothetical protein
MDNISDCILPIAKDISELSLLEQNFKQVSETGDELDLWKTFKPTCQMQASL